MLQASAQGAQGESCPQVIHGFRLRLLRGVLIVKRRRVTASVDLDRDEVDIVDSPSREMLMARAFRSGYTAGERRGAVAAEGVACRTRRGGCPFRIDQRVTARAIAHHGGDRTDLTGVVGTVVGLERRDDDRLIVWVKYPSFGRVVTVDSRFVEPALNARRRRAG